MNRLLVIFILILWTGYAQSTASDSTVIKLEYPDISSKNSTVFPECNRPLIGLALSGGGARCISQLGVIDVLEENHIPIDFIVGTSMGGVVGGLYAVGYSTREILEKLKKISWEDLINDSPSRQSLFLGQKQEQERHILQLRLSNFKPYIPSGLTPGQKVSMQLTDLVMQAPYGTLTDFNQFRIPFRTVTTDLISGQKILLGQGNLADAMCASLAFPLLFTPVEWDSMLLVDGGMTNNIPVEDARAFGMDIVISVDVTSNLRNKNQISLPWEIVDQATTIMQQLNNRTQQTLADIYFRFDLPGKLSSDFSNLDSLVALGRREALAKLPEIQALILRHKKNGIPVPQSFFLNQIRFEGLRHLSLPLLAAQVPLDSLRHRQIDPYSIRNGLLQIYALGYFKDVRGIVTQDSAGELLTIRVQENPLVQAIILNGNTIFPDSVLLKNVQNRPGAVFNSKICQQDFINILKIYRKQGFALAQIQTAEFNAEHALEILLDEGRISAIQIEGNERTQSFVVLREFSLRVNDIFNYEAVKSGIRNIYSTGLFNTVRLNIEYKDFSPQLILKLTEKKFSLVRLGGRYDNERKGRGFIELLNANLFGSGNSLTLHAQSGERDKKLALSFRADRLFKSYLTSQINAYAQNQKYFSYSGFNKSGEYAEYRSGLDYSLGQQIERFGTVSLQGRYQHIKFEPLWGLGHPDEEITLIPLALQSIVDTRDEAPFARKGKYYHFFYEFSTAQILPTDISYFKLYSSLENYGTFLNYHTIHSRIVWGTSDLTTPAAEQFYLGGEDSFPGLLERQLRGRHLMIASLEYRFNFQKLLPMDAYFHFRMDLAGIWEKEVDIKSNDFMSGTGLKFSVTTPLGPFSLAYGQSRNDQHSYYFSAGFQF
jgi:NTE family protein